MTDSNDTSDIPHRSEYMLTTLDNPFDPFSQWDEWYAWDERSGHCSSGLLARIACISDELSELDQHLAVQQAIDEIVRENVSGIHKKVKRGDVVAVAATATQTDA